MSKNYMPEVAKMLGVEIGEEFDVIVENGISECGPFHFDKNWRIRDADGGIVPYWLLEKILIGEYAIQKCPWRPKYDDEYWMVFADGSVYCFHFYKNNANDLANLNMGNCFQTEEAAEAAVPEMMEKFKEIKKGVRE